MKFYKDVSQRDVGKTLNLLLSLCHLLFFYYAPHIPLTLLRNVIFGYFTQSSLSFRIESTTSIYITVEQEKHKVWCDYAKEKLKYL